MIPAGTSRSGRASGLVLCDLDGGGGGGGSRCRGRGRCRAHSGAPAALDGVYAVLITKLTTCTFGFSLPVTATTLSLTFSSRTVSILRLLNRPFENSRLRPNCVTADSSGELPLMVIWSPVCSMLFR